MTARRFSLPAGVIAAAGDLQALLGLSAAQLDILNEMAHGARLEAVPGFPKWRYWLGTDLVRKCDVAELARRRLVEHASLGALDPDASIRYHVAATVRDALAPTEHRS